MEPISPEHRAYVEHNAPDFARAVATLKQILALGQSLPPRRRPYRTAPAVQAELENFAGDMALLYACLWYARTEGVAVTFAPGDGRSS